MFKFIISWQCILHPPSPVLLANEVDLLILIFYVSTNQDPSFNCQVCLMFRYEHSNLSKERIAELVRESLAAVGLKVIVCLPLLTKWTVVWHIACMAFADSGWNYQYNCFFWQGLLFILNRCFLVWGMLLCDEIRVLRSDYLQSYQEAWRRG